MNPVRRALLAAFAALALATPLSAHGAPKALQVYAAASLTDAFKEIGPLYAAHGHPAPVFNFAASSTLAKQIEQGAPADVFVSADEDWMDYLAVRKLIVPSTRKSILSNKLVLVTPVSDPLRLVIAPGFDLVGALHGGKLAMADPDSVPAGKYGRAALQALGVWAAAEPWVVRGDNVRTALRYVETGEAAAGIVYLTDWAADKNRVALAGEFPSASYPSISYPVAAVRGGNGGEARAFEAFLESPDARAAFVKWGFVLR